MAQLTLTPLPVVAPRSPAVAPGTGPLAYLDQPSENHWFLAAVALGGLTTWAITVALAMAM